MQAEYEGSHKAVNMVRIVKILFYCSKYSPSLNYCQGKKHRNALAITLKAEEITQY